jgi:hypothetical protein
VLPSPSPLSLPRETSPFPFHEHRLLTQDPLAILSIQQRVDLGIGIE